MMAAVSPPLKQFCMEDKIVWQMFSMASLTSGCFFLSFLALCHSNKGRLHLIRLAKSLNVVVQKGW